VKFYGETIRVAEATPDSFEGVDIVLASAGGKVSREFAKAAADRGAIVIDKKNINFKLTL
jgi:aspartate-semialdehyde dehydrogenase